MKKFLVAYSSRTGNTEKLADYIAEGVRMAGQQAEVKSITELKKPEDIDGFDGYLLGCPTYHRDMTGGMKTFLFLMENLNLVGKVGGAFGTYTHSGDAAQRVFDTMRYVFKIDMTELGSLNVTEDQIGTPDGIHTGQDYGRAVAGMI